MTLPKIGEKVPTLMEEMAQREEAQRAVSSLIVSIRAAMLMPRPR